MNAYVTTIVTVISGVIVFIVGGIIKEIWLDPLHQYKKIKGDVAFTLTYYANVYTNVIIYEDGNIENRKRHINASEEIRKLSCNLIGFSQTIYWFHPLIPDKKELANISSDLIGLSNSMFASGKNVIHDQNTENKKLAEKIKESLSINND